MCLLAYDYFVSAMFAQVGEYAAQLGLSISVRDNNNNGHLYYEDISLVTDSLVNNLVVNNSVV